MTSWALVQCFMFVEVVIFFGGSSLFWGVLGCQQGCCMVKLEINFFLSVKTSVRSWSICMSWPLIWASIVTWIVYVWASSPANFLLVVVWILRCSQFRLIVQRRLRVLDEFEADLVIVASFSSDFLMVCRCFMRFPYFTGCDCRGLGLC
jgi:hypothetical protein